VAQPLSVVPRGAESHGKLRGTENHHWSAKENSISAIYFGMSAGHVADENSLVLCRFFRKTKISNHVNRTQPTS
jgi:hypothetical protein